ncbi:MAG TPA: DUF3099 domain-containing protein [Ruania sp.]|nr:DUF3099 domain-containing protein [Ruania sp.]
MPEVQAITTAGRPHSEQTREKIRRYLITMGIRTACFIGAIFVDGWFRWVCVALAAVLPLIAVLLANAGGDRRPVRASMVNAEGLPAADQPDRDTPGQVR